MTSRCIGSKSHTVKDWKAFKKEHVLNKKSLIALSVSAAFAAGVFMADYTKETGLVFSKALTPALQQNIADIPALEKMMLDHQAKYNPMAQPTATGSYLAGRSAQTHHDWENADLYMARALQLSEIDAADKSGILDRAFLMAITKGDIKRAMDYGEKIIAQRDGKGELAYILKSITAAKNGDYQQSADILAKIDTKVFGGYAVPLLQAWNAAALGQAEVALGHLDNSDFSDDTAYTLQKALVLDYMGRTSDADAAYRYAMRQGLDLQETLLAANFFERSGDWDTVEKIYTLFSEQEPTNPYLISALKRTAAQQAADPVLNDAEQGVAYTLYKMAHLLFERNASDSALIYSRIAEHIGHGNPDANLLMGDLMVKNGHYDEALGYYNSITSENILFKTAQMKKVGALEKAGQNDQALGVLNNMKTTTPYVLDALVRTGDLHQRSENFEMALSAYDEALDTLGDQANENHWGIFYARGMAYEQLDNWNAAEKDFIKALEYSPENPSILNVLGYTWVDKGVNLDRAMDMIEKAVSMRPHDGYIIDSYGWAFYKLGEYDQATYWLEKAIELHPEDATMNDHLGDAYWQSGRIKEARFQWERANRLSSDSTFQMKMARKLKDGLFVAKETDAVALEEASMPGAL